MDILQIVVLSIVQGLTEFLPISSSAHLILVPIITNWQDQSLSFDIAVHVGTLLAVIFYFRDKLYLMLRDWLLSLTSKQSTDHSRLAWAIVLGTVPLGLAGLFLKSLVENELRSPLVIAIATIIFGILLWYSYRVGQGKRDESTITWKDIVIIGCAQALALIPGTSRSGVTITAGLLAGLDAQAAARFSFLLSIPAISAAGLLMVVDVIKSEQVLIWQSLIIGSVLSALSAYFCIHFFLKLLLRIGMMPFVVYRLVLGGVLLFVFW